MMNLGNMGKVFRKANVPSVASVHKNNFYLNLIKTVMKKIIFYSFLLI